MPDSKDYRLLLDEKFEGQTRHMHAQFERVNDILERIEKQTAKTNNRVTKIEDDLVEYRMIKKYPKIAVGIIAFVVISVIFAFRSIIHQQNLIQSTQKGLKTQIDMINIPVTDTQSGKIYLYPSGMLVDSIINKE